MANDIISQIEEIQNKPKPPSTMDKIKGSVSDAADATKKFFGGITDRLKVKANVDPNNPLKGFGLGESNGKILVDRKKAETDKILEGLE